MHEGNMDFDTDNLNKLIEYVCESDSECEVDDEIYNLAKNILKYVESTGIVSIERCKLFKLIDIVAYKDGVGFVEEILDNIKSYRAFKFRECDNAMYALNKIIDMGDTNYVKRTIASCFKREKFDLYGPDVVELIEHIAKVEGIDFIKSIIDDEEKLKRFGLYMPDEFSESCRASLVADVAEIEGINFIKSIINDNEKLDKLNLGRVGLLNLILFVERHGDESYARSLVCDMMNGSGKKFLPDTKRMIISKAIGEGGDIEYIKTLMNNRDKFGMDLFDVIECSRDTGNYSNTSFDDIEAYYEKGLIKEVIDDCYVPLLDEAENIGSLINLPEDMTVGIEIESEGPRSARVEQLAKFLFPDWDVKAEGSLDDGFEMASPVLTCGDISSAKKIKRACRMLEESGQKATDECGGHIHVGADYLKTKGSLTNFIELWANFEKILYIISNESGQAIRSGVRTYAQPISAILELRLNGENNDKDLIFSNEKSFKNFIVGVEGGSRHYGVNLQYIGHKEKNTIEFRAPNGTVNAETWIENINLFGGLIATAEKLAVIQCKSPEKRTIDEVRMLSIFECVRKVSMTDEQKMKALMTLVIPKSERPVYEKRYEANSKLIEQNHRLKMFYSTFFAQKPIRILEIYRKRFFDYDDKCMATCEEER